eukprot:SM000008S22150  [mRNA]  locus=s8:2373:4612:- [translate_table: standard]
MYSIVAHQQSCASSLGGGAARAAEQLVGLPAAGEAAAAAEQRGRGDAPEGQPEGAAEAGAADVRLPGTTAAAAAAANEADEARDEDAYLLGRTFFDLREYRRAAHALAACRGSKAVFLRRYATYLAGEKRREEAVLEATAEHAGKGGPPVNAELGALEQEMTVEQRAGRLDPFGAFLLGKVLRQLEQAAEARDALCASVVEWPWNWSAWQELQALCTDGDMLAGVTARLEDTWMRAFFVASALLEMQRNTEALSSYQQLAGGGQFPGSRYIAAQTATAYYNLRDFEEAELRFEALLRDDPYRLDAIDTYSNILYVREAFSTLSYLAHKAVLLDKYRPETCCIIGNYYSLKAQHEKAVMYFQRALKLNRHYLSAWTLMGHEYMEMRNTPAAIDAYRHAVDINPLDYRAWYGLGQTYEILAMPFYALYYYR